MWFECHTFFIVFKEGLKRFDCGIDNLYKTWYYNGVKGEHRFLRGRFMKKKIVGLLLFCGVSGLCVTGAALSANDEVELKFKETTLEYGEKVDFNSILKTKDVMVKAEHYDSKKIGKQTVLFSVTDKEKNEKKGSYDFIVKDTKAPVISLKEKEVKVVIGEEYDPKSNVHSCEDPVDGKVSFKVEGNVDVSKAGEYSVTVSAKDKNKNDSVVEFKVIVQESVQSNEENNGMSVSLNVDSSYHYENTAQVMHSVNIGNVGYKFTYPYTERFLNTILSGSKKFYYKLGDLIDADSSLHELVYDYCGLEKLGEYLLCNDENGKYLQLTEEVYVQISSVVLSPNSKHNNYKKWIENALYSMNLYCDDYTMVNQIQQYICNNYSYLVTNASIYNFVETKTGQCWHYANLFKDMCNAVGIPTYYVEGMANGGGHAWNYVVIDGNSYWFDVTWNDYLGSSRWAWLSESEMRLDHSW